MSCIIGCDNTGYSKICNYDLQHDTCHPAIPVINNTYECINGECKPSNKQYNPINGIYGSINQCKAYCQPIPKDVFSYTCNGNSCVQTTDYPTPNNGVYATTEECQSVCRSSKLDQVAYKYTVVNGATGFPGGFCSIVKEYPNINNDTYKNLEECQNHIYSYKCVGTGHNKSCTKVNEPVDPSKGNYSSIQECEQICESNILNIIKPLSYKCVLGYGGNKYCKPSGDLPDSITSFNTYEECFTNCNSGPTGAGPGPTGVTGFSGLRPPEGDALENIKSYMRLKM